MDKLEAMIITMDGIREQYLKDQDLWNLPVDLSEITEIVTAKTSLKIEHRKADWSQENIRGCLNRYEQHAYIFTSNSLNLCWERFVYCKELCHLILDTKESFTADPIQLAEDLITDKILSNEGTSRPDLDSEWMAVVAAIEVLFPFLIRSEFRYAHEQKEMTAYQLAAILRIPQTYVETALSRRYQEMVDDCHRRLVRECKIHN